MAFPSVLFVAPSIRPVDRPVKQAPAGRHHLEGLHFPVQTRDLVLRQAQQNGAESDTMRIMDAMPEQEFAGITDVMKAMGGRNADRGSRHPCRRNKAPAMTAPAAASS